MNHVIAFITLFFLISVSVQAQKPATWKGGTPGRNSDWYCPSNWQEGRVPDEFSAVIIPDVSTQTFHYPLITKGIVEIATLECAPNARITTLGNAQIVILDSTGKTPGCRIEHLSKEKTRPLEDSILANKNYPR